ncbi:MAG: SDR family oxidoreductase [Bdellovibrionaceae bacterium]|nr:SDR family oxidoreductase [Pseudobdellovibrionaceae bacterium]
MSKQRILISGASTGIGFATAVELAAKGHEVYAGVRKASDGERLQKANSQIRTLILDVTVPESVDAAVARVRADSVTESRAPLVLINNAGIAVAGPIECLPLAEFRKQFEVNVFGLIDMTQKFLPLIRETGGRIVNISSISGRLAAPFLGPYSASKFAVEGLTDSLRRELAPQGISVSLIEPGPIRTPIWEKGLSGKDDLLAQIPTERLGIYETRLRKFVEYTAKTAASADPVEVVVRAIEHAAFAKKPRARYFVGGQSKAGNIVSRLPTGWVDGLIRLSARGL